MNKNQASLGYDIKIMPGKGSDTTCSKTSQKKQILVFFYYCTFTQMDRVNKKTII